MIKAIKLCLFGRRTRKQSFTLVELIIVIVIIGILAALVIPRMVSLRQQARDALEKAVVHSVREGLSIYYAESITSERVPLYPADLDSAANGSFSSEDNPFFTEVLRPPGTEDAGWQKLTSTSYLGTSGKTYIYNPATGKFSD